MPSCYLTCFSGSLPIGSWSPGMDTAVLQHSHLSALFKQEPGRKWNWLERLWDWIRYFLSLASLSGRKRESVSVWYFANERMSPITLWGKKLSTLRQTENRAKKRNPVWCTFAEKPNLKNSWEPVFGSKWMFVDEKNEPRFYFFVVFGNFFWTGAKFQKLKQRTENVVSEKRSFVRFF